MAALLGLVAGACLVGALWALRATERPPAPVADPYAPPAPPRFERLTLRVGLAVAAGGAVAVLTRWPVGTLLAAAGGFLGPSVVGAAANRGRSLARMEAVAAWVEMLRDVLVAGNGMEESILATAEVAPAAIAPEATRLAERVSRGDDLVDAFLRFVAELDDVTADRVVAALILASRRSPGNIGDLLTTLANVARENVAMRLEVEAGRSSIRSSLHIITVVTVGFSVGVLVLDHTYAEAYRSAVGQVVLALVAGMFVGAHVWVRRATGEKQGERVLAGVDPAAAAVGNLGGLGSSWEPGR